jgi:hypothetical protein
LPAKAAFVSRRASTRPCATARRSTLREEHPAQALALVLWSHGDVLDPEMIGMKARFDEPDYFAVERKKVELMLADGTRVIGSHGERLTADDGNPSRVSGAHELADAFHVLRIGEPKFDRGRVGHDAFLDCRRKKPRRPAGGQGCRGSRMMGRATLPVFVGLSKQARRSAAKWSVGVAAWWPGSGYPWALSN